ncbi:MAG: helix-turn-helix domain-containing protein, partial [Sarcina sp.]
SIGRTYRDIYHAKKSYEEAMKALKLYKKSGMKERVIEYSKLGIYRLLFEIDNIYEIKSYHDDILGELIEYDKSNNTKFLYTITQYLLNNCNLIKTSQVMFIHRNTLIYRLNKIKTILNKDLEDPMDRLELLNAIMISNYLASQE